MKVALISLLLVAFVTYANAAQTAKYFCRYASAGAAKSVELTIDIDVGDPAIVALVGTIGGTDCSLPYTAGNNEIIVVEAANNGGATGVCGAVSDGGSGYTVTLRTSSCANCLTDVDREYAITCPFTSVNTDETQQVEISGTTVSNTVAAGSPTVHSEDISLAVLNEDGTALPATVALGASIILRATLAIASGAYAKGAKLISCVAKDSTDTRTVNIFDNTGCTTSGLNIIPANRGFKKNDVLSSPTSFAADSPAFKAFIFTNKGNTILFRCTATFCYTDDTNCVKSCGTDNTKRRRRAADKSTERRVMITLRVSTDNSTSPTVTRAGHGGQPGDDCSNRSYIIGLVILGCVLVLTFVVAIGMLIVVKRGRQNNGGDKFGLDNKA